jgi:hypothetical protein
MTYENQQNKPPNIVEFQVYKNHLDKTREAFPTAVGLEEDFVSL